MSDRDSDHMLLELQEARAEIDRLRELLRWRKWPEEKPVESGTYLVATEDAHCPVAYPLLTYYGASIGWPDYMSVTYWRPIGPMPGGAE